MQELKKSSDIKLENTLAFLDGGIDIEAIPEYQEMAKQMKKFYFGYSELNVETILTYLMVTLIFRIKTILQNEMKNDRNSLQF